MILIKRSVKSILCGMTVMIIVMLFSALTANAAVKYSLKAPVLNKASNTSQGVQLEWSAVKKAPKYRIYYKTTGNWKKLADTTLTTYTHKTAVSGTKYTYTVCCISANGKRFLSRYDTKGRSITFIRTPQIKSAANVSNGIKLTWNSVKGAAKYSVLLRDGATWKVLANTGACSYTHKQVVSGQSYVYALRCVNVTGKKITSGTGAAKSFTFVKEPSVTGFSDELNGTKLEWTAREGAAKYRVFVRNGSTWNSIGVTEDTTISYLTAHDVTNTFTVRCLDENGAAVSSYNEKGWSHHYMMPEAPLESPAITDFESTENGLMIRWNPVEEAENYMVLTKVDDVWTILDKTTDTSYLYQQATSGVTGVYTIACISADGQSYTGMYNTKGKTFTYVKAPVIKKIVNTSCGPMLTWDSVKGASRYQIMTLSQGDEWMPLAETTETAYIHTEAENNTTYTYTVLCLNAGGNPVSAYNTGGSTNLYQQSATNIVFTKGKFVSAIAAKLGKNLAAPSNPNYPLTRKYAAESLVEALNYEMRKKITLSDTTNTKLQTVAYYGYFIPDSSDRIFPNRQITASEYNAILKEVGRYAQLKNKRVLAFGDSIMYGSGNKVRSNGKTTADNYEGMAAIIAGKYGMVCESFAVCGATFSIRSDRDHISEQIYEAYKKKCKPDIILLNGGTNDMNLVARGVAQDYFDPKYPQNSTFAFGFEYTLKQIKSYWKNVPILYIRVHNMDTCSDKLERQLGDYGITICKNKSISYVDLYRNSKMNTEIVSHRIRYTKVNNDCAYGHDSIHPNALGFATFYVTPIGDKVTSLLNR